MTLRCLKELKQIRDTLNTFRLREQVFFKCGQPHFFNPADECSSSSRTPSFRIPGEQLTLSALIRRRARHFCAKPYSISTVRAKFKGFTAREFFLARTTVASTIDQTL